MNQEQFERIFDQQIKRCEEILVSKAREYADDGDRLHNFNVAAELQGTTPQQALAGFMAKHTVSVYDMCRAPEGAFTMDQWKEKVTDHINYLILLMAIVSEAESGIEEASGQLTITGGIFRPGGSLNSLSPLANIDSTP